MIAFFCDSILTWSQLALREHDEKQLFFARQNLIDIRNVYAVMTDILHKNIAKVRRDIFAG